MMTYQKFVDMLRVVNLNIQGISFNYAIEISRKGRILRKNN